MVNAKGSCHRVKKVRSGSPISIRPNRYFNERFYELGQMSCNCCACDKLGLDYYGVLSLTKNSNDLDIKKA